MKKTIDLNSFKKATKKSPLAKSSIASTFSLENPGAALKKEQK
jgi:hypothetical protein